MSGKSSNPPETQPCPPSGPGNGIERYDLTAFCWRLAPKDPLRVRLLIYCAPGWGRALAQRLKDRSIRARARAATCVAVDVPADVHRCLVGLGAPLRVLEASSAYAAACEERPSMFQEVSEESRRARRHAVAQMVRHAPARGA